MSVTSITEDWTGLAFNGQVDLTSASGTLPRKFIVVFDNNDAVYNRPILALTASASGITIPDWWEAHPGGTDFYVKRKTVAPYNGPLSWVVTCEYEYVENPLEQGYVVQFTPQSSQEAIDTAIDGNVKGKKLCNSANEPFDPPIQEEFYDVGINITRNEASFNITKMAAYFNTVNSDTFAFTCNNGVRYSFDPGKVRCKSIQAEEMRHGQIWYFKVSYEFVVRDDGWKRRILDQGFREIVDGGYKSILDEEGNPITQPVNLNGNGRKLEANANPVFLTFQTKYERAFSGFGF